MSNEKPLKNLDYFIESFWKEHTFVIMDTETNGLDPEIHEPCEVAMLKIEGGIVGDPSSWYVKPNLPIPPHVQAVHHISNDDVKDAPPMKDLEKVFQEYCKDSIVIAHNAPFDKSMMPCLQGQEFKWLDNLRLARHMWPLGTPNKEGHPLNAHKNKILQHWMNLDVDTKGQAAHRAQADILVTAEIFKIGMNTYLERLYKKQRNLVVPSYEKMASDLEKPCKVELMPFGPHKDKPIEEVPTQHLRSLVFRHNKGESNLGIDLFAALNKEYNKRVARMKPGTAEKPEEVKVETERKELRKQVNENNKTATPNVVK